MYKKAGMNKQSSHRHYDVTALLFAHACFTSNTQINFLITLTLYIDIKAFSIINLKKLGLLKRPSSS